ncbi:MAG: YwiC-like family protein [Bowdeniella nasicola]|nr:YwiC-like family protein [Bowdeniella nasicola]
MTASHRCPPPPSARRTKKRRRGRSNSGWVPQHHGAWAMITLPPIAGMLIGGPRLSHLPLLALWWVGYFFFFAASLWLKSRRKARYFPPVRTYGIITIILGIIVLAVTPWLVVWVLWFAPLIAISLWLVLHRRERSVTNDLVTIIAACLMTLVAFDASLRPDPWWASAIYDPAGVLYPTVWEPSLSWGGTPVTTQGWAWRVGAVLFVYFFGTVPHVKALIRERDNPWFTFASILYHLLALVGAAVMVTRGWWPGGLAGSILLLAAGIALVRAIVMPWYQRRYAPLSAKVIGQGELGLTLVVTIAIVMVC